MDLSLLKRLNKERRERRPVILVTDTRSGEQHLYGPDDSVGELALRDEVSARFYSGKSGTVGDHFISVYLPSPRLVVIGAVHISQHLVAPATAAGFDVTIIDPRTAFASEERFPDVALFAEWPDVILQEKPLDPFTALAALTHDPKIDDLPLSEGLKAGCFYVGALGSRKTHGKRVDRLKERGHAEAEINRINAPIGLDIGASSPAEIAIAVLAEVIAARRKKLPGAA
ncbi:MAG: XdhC family protein [Pseudomonadota bacterium]